MNIWLFHLLWSQVMDQKVYKMLAILSIIYQRAISYIAKIDKYENLFLLAIVNDEKNICLMGLEFFQAM